MNSAMFALVFALPVAQLFASTDDGSVVSWANRVIVQADYQPAWKVVMAKKVLNGTVGVRNMLPTAYSDKDHLDPGTGGGPWGCTWTNPDGRRRQAVRLKDGHVAADLRYHPTGTVMYADAPYWGLWFVVDCGPGVRGANRVDVYCSNTPQWVHYRQNVRGRIKVHILGRVTREQLVSAGM